jgi:transcription antitermination factor NusG
MNANAPISPPAEPAQQWYAFSVRSRHEKSVGVQLEEKQETLFLPLVRQERRWGSRLASVDMPLLPGYIFCRSHRFGLLPILKTPGIIDVLRAGTTPVPVPHEEIEALQSAIAARMSMEACPFVTIGQTVRIERGALAGLSGIVVDVKSTKRLVLSVTLLQRSVLVQLDPGYLGSA